MTSRLVHLSSSWFSFHDGQDFTIFPVPDTCTRYGITYHHLKIRRGKKPFHVRRLLNVFAYDLHLSTILSAKMIKNVYKGKWKVKIVKKLYHILLFGDPDSICSVKSRCIMLSNCVKYLSNACELSGAQKTFQLQFLRDSAKAARLCQMVPCMNLNMISTDWGKFHCLMCQRKCQSSSEALEQFPTWNFGSEVCLDVFLASL